MTIASSGNVHGTTGSFPFLVAIHEQKGRQELYIRQKPVELERLVEIAKIQSTESSNKIEGIGTSNARMRQLVAEKTTPRTRDEEEIAGYRDALKMIHDSYAHMPVSSNIILQLHQILLSYTSKSYGGKFKNIQNYISETLPDGSEATRFTPLAPFETPDAIAAICTSYQQAIEQQFVDPLILIPIFICDFLCIHPFIDGNGRMSRLLTTLLLYQNGFMVGKYISLEKKIELTKESYYEVLGQISAGWREGKNDDTPFITYFLGIVLNSYRDFEDRLGSVDRKSTAYAIVRKAVSEKVGLFRKAEILESCHRIMSSSVEAALKKLKDEGYVLVQGKGKNTRYMRNPDHQ